MKSAHTQNNFFSYLLILLSLFVLIFFTKNFFSDMQVLLDEKAQNTIIEQEKKDTLSELQALKAQLNEEGSEALMEIQGFQGEFSDKDILNYIHEYVGQVNAGNEKILIRSLSVSGDQVSDLGFNRADIDVSASFSSEATLFAFMNYLTSQEGQYRFYISNFSYPLGNTAGNIQVAVPLTLYYK